MKIPANAIEVATTFLWRENNIFYVIHKENAHITLEDSLQIKEIHDQIREGRSSYILADLSKIAQLDKEVRHYNEKRPFTTVIKIALIVKSPLSKIIGNLMANIFKKTVPTRLFTSIKKAEAWLLEEEVNEKEIQN